MTTDPFAMALFQALTIEFQFQSRKKIKRVRSFADENQQMVGIGRIAPRPPRFWTAKKIRA